MTMRFTRRQFAASAVAAMTLAALPTRLMASSQPFAGGKLHSFSDGSMNLPIESVFYDIFGDDRQKFLKAAQVLDGIWRRPVNVNLLEIGDRKILFDVGSGINFLPTLGELPAALDAADVDISAITDVVFTHAHPDHIWGILDDFDDLLMPDAAYHISQAEWDFWDSDDAVSAMVPGRESFAVGAKSRFDKLRDQISFFKGGDEVLSGIEAVDTSGHTPGHTSFLIHNSAGPVLIAGDALTHPVISIEHPEWQNPADMDREKAAVTRKRLLDRLASEKIGLAATHLPAPGFGRVESNQSAWRYVATDS
ncbi:MBL fold metallo-hydrolase [Alphaproteobacteria bacterium]|nr:MBL fold metallo-hydrolase [Alphaproteobacteria bacterium]MDC0101813.1 MBL fold metallo-hydrolase [Alphaproteobacteria bacterium]